MAKASTLGVLVLIAIMTFLFRGYEYSRLVIAGFWAASIVMVSLSRAAFREALRFARRNGYNQRYAVVVGGGEPAAEVLRAAAAPPGRRDPASWACSATSATARAPACRGWAVSRRSATC